MQYIFTCNLCCDYHLFSFSNFSNVDTAGYELLIMMITRVWNIVSKRTYNIMYQVFTSMYCSQLHRGLVGNHPTGDHKIPFENIHWEVMVFFCCWCSMHTCSEGAVLFLLTDCSYVRLKKITVLSWFVQVPSCWWI